MTGGMRPSRGRPGRVTKAASTPRRTGRQQQQHISAQHVAGAAAEPESVLHPALQRASDLGDSHVGKPDSSDAVHDDDMADAEADDDVAPPHPHPHQHSHLGGLELSTAASILANGGSIMPDESHDAGDPPSDYPVPPEFAHSHGHPHGHGHGHGHGGAPTTQDVARDSGYGAIVVESALAKRLAQEPGLRPAQQRRPDQVLNLGRRSNVEALFAHIAGEEAQASCKNCHKGHGPWTSCVVVDGQMCGSCANCWFNASGARCSFHEARTPQSGQLHPQSHHLASGSSVAVAPSAPVPNPYALSSGVPLAPPPAGPSLGASNFGAGPPSNDPTFAYIFNKAVAEVRAADKSTRQFMRIEIRAKQLALEIVGYEEDRAPADASGAPQALMGGEGSN